MVIGFPLEKRMYYVENLSWPAANDYGWETRRMKDDIYSASSNIPSYVQDLPSHLSRSSLGDDFHYVYDKSATQSLQFDYYITGSYMTAAKMFSKGGKWVVVVIPGRGLIRMDLTSGNIKLFTRNIPKFGYGSNPAYSFDITDDGEYAIAAGRNVTPRIYHITDDCGEESTEVHQKWGNSSYTIDECDLLEIRKKVGDGIGATGYGIRFMDNVHLSDDEGQIIAQYSSYENGSGWVKISAGSYTEAEQLEYLALGDSYSSGEGDIEKKSDGSTYYTPVTDYAGGCHLSTRSYPFLLRDKWGISEDSMQSVACSGAKVMPDYDYPLSNYLGQGYRLEDSKNIDTLRSRALEVFIPGYVPQLEFVKKYQPKTLTLTGGGNDVGFADILKYCLYPEIVGPIPIPYTCEYAKDGSELSAMFDDSVKTQKAFTIRLLERIKEVSPDTKVIIVGYPSFITSDYGCALNTASLNKSERTFINRAVHDINRMLKSAASKAGATYVDVEDSLVDGRLCEGSRYVTGLWLERYYNEDEQHNAFHPNALGHWKIASAVYEQIPDPNSIPVDTDDGSVMESFVTTIQAYFTDLVTYINESLTITGEDFQFSPESDVEVTIYSTPTHLGTLQVSSKGAISGELSIEGIGPGQHVLVLEGKSYSGEDVRYYQYVTIGAEEGDIDGDGIPDNEDKCAFIENWIDETSGNDVCRVDARPIINEDGDTSDTLPAVQAGDTGNTTEGSRGNSDEITAMQNNSPNDTQTVMTGFLDDVTTNGIGNVPRRGYLVGILGISCLITGGILYVKRRNK